MRKSWFYHDKIMMLPRQNDDFIMIKNVYKKTNVISFKIWTPWMYWPPWVASRLGGVYYTPWSCPKSRSDTCVDVRPMIFWIFGPLQKSNFFNFFHILGFLGPQAPSHPNEHVKPHMGNYFHLLNQPQGLDLWFGQKLTSKKTCRDKHI